MKPKGRPKIEDKKEKISITINAELAELLEKVATEKGVSVSKYIEYLIKKDKK